MTVPYRRHARESPTGRPSHLSRDTTLRVRFEATAVIQLGLRAETR
jgi:hypothetical protein